MIDGTLQRICYGSLSQKLVSADVGLRRTNRQRQIRNQQTQVRDDDNNGGQRAKITTINLLSNGFD